VILEQDEHGRWHEVPRGGWRARVEELESQLEALEERIYQLAHDIGCREVKYKDCAARVEALVGEVTS
jgi:hypothetical protein